MRINHNIAALNTYRQLTGNVGNTGKSLEKLSSGLRINKAGDDAAGLAISEKMRAQIRGLDQATRNASDGISLIQTAEGALTETHSILQRMRELAVQSATDTNTTEDRKEIQKEINNLVAEVDRIAKETQFNKQNLLNGDYNKALDVKYFQIGANSSQNLEVKIADMQAGALNAVALDDGKAKAEITLNAKDVTVSTNGNGKDWNGIQVVFKKAGGDDTSHAWNGTVLEVSVGAANGVTDGYNVTAAGGKPQMTINVTATVLAADVTGETVTLTGGGTGLEEMSINYLDGGKGGVLSRTDADNAIVAIDKAISQVSSERAKLGGIQNRLEHTINNLGATSENLAASESRIRDVDMAKEMMEFTKNNILSQASQAMLAQANMQPQSVLQLLQ